MPLGAGCPGPAGRTRAPRPVVTILSNDPLGSRCCSVGSRHQTGDGSVMASALSSWAVGEVLHRAEIRRVQASPSPQLSYQDLP